MARQFIYHMLGLTKTYPGNRKVLENINLSFYPDAKIGVLGVAASKAILDRYNELAMNYSDETADEMTRLQDEIEAKGLWDLDSKIDQAMEALVCPPDDAEVTH